MNYRSITISSLMLLILFSNVLWSTPSVASYCNGGVHLGFGVFMKNEHKCETETKRLQNCHYAEVSNERFWYSGAHCVLSENNAYYQDSFSEYDFKVKSFKIRPITESDGAQCFEATRTSGPTSSSYYFCDLQRGNLFDKASVQDLFQKRSKFSSTPATLNRRNVETPTQNIVGTSSIVPLDAFVSFTSQSYFTDSSKAYSSAKKLTKSKQPMSQEYFDGIKGTFAEEYLTSKRKNKAMVGAFPLTCNYRYSSWNYSSLREAYQRAKGGCETKVNDRNKVLGQKCKCRVIALNNVMFYEPGIYIGEQGQVPILARVIENGQQIEIKGKVKIADKGSSKSAFTVETNAGVKACEGSFDISDTAIGRFSMNCFDGKYVGSGDFVTTGFNPELQIANGTAEFTATNGAKMFVIFGEDAE